MSREAPVTEPTIHGIELDEAMDAAADPARLLSVHGVCETALGSRTTSVVDSQLQFAADLDDHRVAAAEGGLADELLADDDFIAILGIRAAIGGAFSWGLLTGLELKSAQVQRLERELAQAQADLENVISGGA